MADMYLGASAEPELVSGPTVLGSIVNWTGALMSVALVGGLGMWGYQLAVRDVSGVPVVRALEGPMRVAPDDPGGDQAEHQGFAVNRVAADGTAEGPADVLVLAPPPLDLSDEDLPKPALADGAAPETSDADMLALADELGADATPLAAPLDTLDTLDALDAPDTAGATIEIIPETVPGVVRSPVPLPRPDADLTALAVADSVVLPVAAPAVEVEAADVAPGTRLVQFGAFASPEEARAEWRRLDERFTDFLIDKKRVIERAVSGGKTFYRLRAMGFADISDARRFCSAFVADRQACIPVVAR